MNLQRDKQGLNHESLVSHLKELDFRQRTLEYPDHF